MGVESDQIPKETPQQTFERQLQEALVDAKLVPTCGLFHGRVCPPFILCGD